MVMNNGISPALKYIVITTKRYQNFRFHIFSWVNMKPKKAEAKTVAAVPITVLATETVAANGNPFSCNT